MKRKDLKIFHVVLLIITELGQNLTHLAHKANTQSESFEIRQAKNFNCILLS
jgi:hypothetical protein